ncbi:MAG: hypothetical protein DRN81_04110 [Thermoproteota archaeon]|nr:MAG: hypothetical protein DRN81_04110 [Candidatus Korarchaeota archaeon]
MEEGGGEKASKAVNIKKLLKTAIAEAKKPVYYIAGQEVAFVFVNGFVLKRNIEGVTPITIPGKYYGMDGIQLDGVDFTLSRGWFESYSKHIRIPTAIIRCVGDVTVVEASGLMEAEITPSYAIWVARPSPLGWIMLLSDVEELKERLQQTADLSTLFTILRSQAELTRRALNVSIAGSVADELRAPISLIRPTERDLQEFVKQQYAKLFGRREET